MGIEETAKGPVVMVEGTRVMIPRGARKQMLALLHESHLAEGAMIATARRLWWWPGMNNEVRDLYRNCQACQVESRAKERQPAVIPDDLQRLGVLELVGCDLFQVGTSHYIILVDKKTGFRLCSHLKRTTTEDVISVLSQWFYQFGFPSRLRSDNGPQFRGRFTEWCTSIGIQHEPSSCYNPSSNGLAERSVAVVKNMLKKTGAGAVKGEKLDKLMFSLNSMSRESAAGSPLDHFLGRSVKSQLPNSSLKVISFRKEIERRKLEQQKWMKRIGRGSSTAFQVGDQVRVQNALTGKWSVKGTIGEVIEHDGGESKSYKVVSEDGAEYHRNGRFIKIRISKLKAQRRVRFVEGA